MDITLTLVLITTSLLFFIATVMGTIRLGPVWDMVSSWRTRSLKIQAEEISLDMSELERWLRVWGVCLAALPLFFWLFLDLLTIGLGLAYLVYIAPEIILEHLIARRRILLRDQLVAATQCLANTSRAGLNLHQGLREVVKETQVPLSSELDRIVKGYDSGQSMHESIEMARKRLQLEPFTLFASAIQIALDRGGRINEALTRICKSLTDAQRIERKLEADTAGSKRAAIILSMFPFVFLGLFYVLDPDTIGLLFNGFLGQAILLSVMALVYIGCRMALRILDIQA